MKSQTHEKGVTAGINCRALVQLSLYNVHLVKLRHIVLLVLVSVPLPEYSLVFIMINNNNKNKNKDLVLQRIDDFR